MGEEIRGMASSQLLWQHADGTIELMVPAFRFFVKYRGEETPSSHHASWAEAVIAIDARAEREKRNSQVKLSIPVLDPKKGGEGFVRRLVTGIHAGTGNYTCTPQRDKHSELYIDSPLGEAALRIFQRALIESTRASLALTHFELPNKYTRHLRGIVDNADVQAWFDKVTAGTSEGDKNGE